MNTPIKVMDFCRVVSRKGTQGSGLALGQVLLIITLKALPETRRDPYLQRIYAVAVLVNETIEVPAESNEYQSYLIDPRHLEKVSAEEQETYIAMIEEQFGEEDERTSS